MTTLHTVERLRELFGDRLTISEPLSRHTTARVGGPAELFLTVASAEELRLAVEVAHDAGLPYLILGGGSNILVADSGISGLVILNRARKVSFRHSGAGVVCVAESGANLSALARQCISRGLGGLEWAIGVPGTVGGAVVGNAGAHGADIDANFLAATVLEPGYGVRVYNREEMAYSYRTSVLKRVTAPGRARRVVLSAELRLTPEPVDVLTARADVGQSGQFQQPLHRTVLAEGAVEHGEEHVQFGDDRQAGRTVTGVEGQQCGGRLVGRRFGQERCRAGGGPLAQRGHRVAGQPAAVLGDSDGHDLIAGGVERGHHRARRAQRDFVLAGAAAEEDADAEFCGSHCYSCLLSVVSCQLPVVTDN